MKFDKKAYTLPDMELYGGETRSLVVTLTRSDGTYYSYSTASELTVTLTFSPVKVTTGWGKYANAVSPVLTKTATISEDSDLHGIATFDFVESDTKELRGKYIYQIEVKSATGDSRVAQGHLYIKRNINTDLVTSVVYCTVTFVYDGETVYEETVKRRKTISYFPTIDPPTGYTVDGWIDTDSENIVTEETLVTTDMTLEPNLVCAHSQGTTIVAENVVSPTCTATGSYESVTYCSTCGEELSRTTVSIAATGHTQSSTSVIENYTAPTCTTAGSQDIVYYCETCGAEISRTTQTIAATGHTAADAVSENATSGICTAGGTYESVVYCSVCGTELSRVTVTYEAAGHQYVSVTTEPTCTEQGYTTYTCSVCGDSYVDDYTDATGHNYVAVVTAPTCTEAGYTTYTCSNCGDGYIDDITSATGHSYVTTVVSPTCTEQGYTIYVCENCGDTYYDDYTSATGHTYDSGVVTTAATCTTAGVRTYTCTVCGATKTGTVAATGHTQATTTSVVTEATCTTTGTMQTVIYCSVCGATISTTVSTIEATGHTEGEAVIENYVEPTYSSEGSYDEVVYCETCGEELSRTSYTIDKLSGATAYTTKTISSTTYARNSSGTIGNYWIGSFGVDTSSTTTYYIDSSLSSGTVSVSGIYNDSQATVAGDSYLIFAGGYTTSTASAQVRAISSSLVVTSCTALSTAVVRHSAASIGDYALFLGGTNYYSTSYSQYLTTYDTSLTKRLYTPTAYSTYLENMFPGNVGDYAIFVGGVNALTPAINEGVYYISSTLSIQYTSFVMPLYRMGNYVVNERAVQVGEYAVILYPRTAYMNDSGTGYSTSSTEYCVWIDSALTSGYYTVSTGLANGYFNTDSENITRLLGTEFGDVAIFGDYKGNTAIMDSSLTITNADSMLSGGNKYYGLAQCGTVGNYALFVHGNESTSTVDVYTVES